MTNSYSVHYECGKDYSTKKFDNFEDALSYYFRTKNALEFLYRSKFVNSIRVLLEVSSDSFDEITL